MFYRPDKKSVCADVIPFYKDNEFKLFYLKDYRDLENVGEGCDWNLLTTKDLVHFTEHGTVLKRGKKNEQDLYVYTGSIIEKNGLFYIFYTGHNPHFFDEGKPVQCVLLATSKDLIHWEKQKEFVYKPDFHYLEQNDFRDPFVFKDEEKDEYVMILTSRLKNDAPIEHRGLLLKATSKDLIHWEMEEEPFYAPHAYYAHECPDIFKIGEWYYLIFSEFCDRYVTTYRMAKSLKGPWITPKHNTFDGHCFYAAKSVSDGKRRILFGWNPIKNNENDDEFWQWGGSIIPHEIYQNDDFTLSVRCPQEIKDSFSKKVEFSLRPLDEDVQVFENKICFSNENRNLVKIGKVPFRTKIEFDVTLRKKTGDFGVYLYEEDHYNKYYKLRFDLEYDRMIIDIWPRYNRAIYGQIEVERPCKLLENETNHVMLIIEETILEVYVNDKVAMSMRLFKAEGEVSFYSQATICEIKNINIYEG